MELKLTRIAFKVSNLDSGQVTSTLELMRNLRTVKVTGGGSKTLPSGVALPGAYKNTDPGLWTQLWCRSHYISLVFLLAELRFHFRVQCQ